MRVKRMFGRWHRYQTVLLRREFAVRLWRRCWKDDVSGRAAQLSYYFLLSLFPLLICLSAILGYVFAAETRLEDRLFRYLGSIMPSSAFRVVRETADELLRTRGSGTLSFGLLMALWVASSGMEAIIEGLNAAFQVKEARPWWRRRLVALVLTVMVDVLVGGALALALAGSAGSRLLAEIIGFGRVWTPLWHATEFAGSMLLPLVAIALIYSFGPNLKARRESQVLLPGAVVALFCWVIASAGLRLYLDHFSSFGRTYGSLGAVIALLVWLYVSGMTLLLGAEVNSGIEAGLNEVPKR
jgi:membrane protein